MPGGKPTMHYAISFFGEVGSEIIYPDPGFPIYRSMIKFSGAKPVPLYLEEQDNFEINLEKKFRFSKLTISASFNCLTPS